eukprot:ANDGO_02388.mRNA.1 hypothetical protein
MIVIFLLVCLMLLMYVAECGFAARGIYILGYRRRKWSTVQTQFHCLACAGTSLRILDFSLNVLPVVISPSFAIGNPNPKGTDPYSAACIYYEWCVSVVMFLSFLIVALYWLELSAGSFGGNVQRSMKLARRKRRRLLAGISIFSFVLFTLVFIIFEFVVKNMLQADALITGVYLPVLGAINALFFILYGSILHRRMQKSTVILGASSNRVQTMNNVRNLGIVCSTAFLLRSLTAALLNNWLSNDIDPNVFWGILIMYYFFFELLPLSVVMYTLRPGIRRKKSTLYNEQTKEDMSRPLYAQKDTAFARDDGLGSSGSIPTMSPSAESVLGAAIDETLV